MQKTAAFAILFLVTVNGVRISHLLAAFVYHSVNGKAKRGGGNRMNDRNKLSEELAVAALEQVVGGFDTKEIVAYEYSFKKGDWFSDGLFGYIVTEDAPGKLAHEKVGVVYFRLSRGPGYDNSRDTISAGELAKMEYMGTYSGSYDGIDYDNPAQYLG